MSAKNFQFILYLYGEYIGIASSSCHVGTDKLVQYCGRIYRVISRTSYCRGSMLDVIPSIYDQTDHILTKDW